MTYNYSLFRERRLIFKEGFENRGVRRVDPSPERKAQARKEYARLAKSFGVESIDTVTFLEAGDRGRRRRRREKENRADRERREDRDRERRDGDRDRERSREIDEQLERLDRRRRRGDVEKNRTDALARWDYYMNRFDDYKVPESTEEENIKVQRQKLALGTMSIAQLEETSESRLKDAILAAEEVNVLTNFVADIDEVDFILDQVDYDPGKLSDVDREYVVSVIGEEALRQEDGQYYDLMTWREKAIADANDANDVKKEKAKNDYYENLVMHAAYNEAYLHKLDSDVVSELSHVVNECRPFILGGAGPDEIASQLEMSIGSKRRTEVVRALCMMLDGMQIRSSEGKTYRLSPKDAEQGVINFVTVDDVVSYYKWDWKLDRDAYRK